MKVRYTQNILVENKIFETKEGKLPKKLDSANLNNLFVDQFVTWDKVHRKFIPEYDYWYVHTTYKNHILKFQRKFNGKFYVSKELSSRERVTLTKCKHTDKVRLCLGVDVTTYVNDVVEQPPEGRRCKNVVYSGKTLIRMTEFKRKVQN